MKFARPSVVAVLGAGLLLIPVAAVQGTTAPPSRWVPYGPHVGSLVLTYFADASQEQNAFGMGTLDLMDWPLAPPTEPDFESSPDFVVTSPLADFGMFLIDVNHESSTWSRWGCDFENGNSACGVDIRAGFAHLYDRPAFAATGLTMQGRAQPLADPSPSTAIPSGSTLAVQNGWDQRHTTVSAFNIAFDPGGFAQLASPDFCAAAEHMIAAGLAAGMGPGCVLTGLAAGVLSNPLRFEIRTDWRRRELGLGLTAAINALFGAPVVAPQIVTINQASPIVFTAHPDYDDWDFYIGGWFLGAPFATHLGDLYGSEAASSFCGGKRNRRPRNYGFICLAEFDKLVGAAMAAATPEGFASATRLALDEFGRHVPNFPAWTSAAQRFAYLNGWERVVDAKGIGPINDLTFLGARVVPGYGPSDPTFAPGGGDSSLLRWGQSNGTAVLNPFLSRTLWEFYLLGRLYDSLLKPNPLDPTQLISWMANSYQVISGPSFARLGYTPPEGTGTTLRFALRRNLRWHDGQAVQADDVKFSLLNLRDFAEGAMAGSMASVVDVTIVDPWTVDVHMEGPSFLHPLTLSWAQILPRHLLEEAGDRTYGDVGRVDKRFLDPSFDLMQNHLLVGSGPFVCKDLWTSQAGGGCAENATGQALSVGATVQLAAFDKYHRSAARYREFDQADRDRGTVPGDGMRKVTILDLARAGLKPGTPLLPVLSHFDETWTAPYGWTELEGIDLP